MKCAHYNRHKTDKDIRSNIIQYSSTGWAKLNEATVHFCL